MAKNKKVDIAIDENIQAVPSVAGLSDTQLLQKFGNSGTDYWSGYFMEEPNAIWRDEQRVETVEEMRRTDASVKAALYAVKSPILSAEYDVHAASEDPKDEEIEEFVEKQLFGMRRSFQEFLREALCYLDFGHYVFEKIWILDNGQIRLADLEPRIPHSIMKWEINGTGENKREKGITQFVKNNIEEAGNTGSNFEIPWKKLFVLTNEQEGDDVTGQSVLRAAYRSFFIKTKLYTFQAIGIERGAVGIPVGEYPPESSAEDKAQFEAILQNIRASNASYITHKTGYKVSYLTVGNNPLGQAIKDGIEHHSRQIFLNVLAQFLDLGSGDSGSFALSKDQSSFFLQNLQEKADYIAEKINALIKEIVDLNYTGVTKYPTFRFAPLGTVDFTEITNILKTLVDAGLVKADDNDIQTYMRNALRLPEKDEETAEEEMAKKLEMELQDIEMNSSEFDFADEIDTQDDTIDNEQPDNTQDETK